MDCNHNWQAVTSFVDYYRYSAQAKEMVAVWKTFYNCTRCGAAKGEWLLWPK